MELVKAKGTARYWILAIPISLILSLQPRSCDLEPAPVPAAVQLDELARQKEKEVAEVYSKMSDAERMRGIVYEPIVESEY